MEDQTKLSAVKNPISLESNSVIKNELLQCMANEFRIHLNADFPFNKEMTKENRDRVKGAGEVSTKLKILQNSKDFFGSPKREKRKGVLNDIKNTDRSKKPTNINLEFCEEKVDSKRKEGNEVENVDATEKKLKQENSSEQKNETFSNMNDTDIFLEIPSKISEIYEKENCNSEHAKFEKVKSTVTSEVKLNLKSSEELAFGSPMQKIENDVVVDLKSTDNSEKLPCLNPEFSVEQISVELPDCGMNLATKEKVENLTNSNDCEKENDGFANPVEMDDIIKPTCIKRKFCEDKNGTEHLEEGKEIFTTQEKLKNLENFEEHIAGSPEHKNENGAVAVLQNTDRHKKIFMHSIEQISTEHPNCVKNVADEEEKLQSVENVNQSQTENGFVADAMEFHPFKNACINLEFKKGEESVIEHPEKTDVNLGDDEEKSKDIKSSEVHIIENSEHKNENNTMDVVKSDNHHEEVPCISPEFSEEQKSNVEHPDCVKNLAGNEGELKIQENSRECVVGSHKPTKKDNVPADVKDIKTTVKTSVNLEFYEEEKGDIEHPEWEKVKKLDTNEERYRQVRDCWGSKQVPNPNKNLTYHSFRKRNQLLVGEAREIKAHKRQASSSIDERKTKRSRTRSCIYHIETKINSIQAEKDLETQRLDKDLSSYVDRLERDYRREDAAIRNYCNNMFGMGYLPRRSYYDLRGAYEAYRSKLLELDYNYQAEREMCEAKYEAKIRALNKVKNEIYQFYKFYKGLNDNDDPTYLEETQLKELNEIEDIYTQFDKHYQK